jgi:hypothetical protein
MARKATQQAGAQAERDAIRAFLRRRKRQYETEGNPGGEPRMVSGSEEIEAILDWLSERAARFRAESGGLGRAKRAAS